MTIRAAVCLISSAILLCTTAGCIGRAYKPQPDSFATVLARAESRTQGDVRVTTVVPSPAEAQKFFDLDLYGRGIQPVWLEVENNSNDQLRFAPTGLDRAYFSPLEVAYVLRAGLTRSAQAEVDRYLRDSTMPRHIPPGTAVSGFVFTHSSPGTKGFSIDLFGAIGGGYAFTFFIPVPGFIPDHAEIETAKLYPAEQLRNYEINEFKTVLAEQPQRADLHDKPGSGRPINLILVGVADDLNHALLRSGWYEIPRPAGKDEVATAQHLKQRVADAVFRKRRQGGTDRNELLLWLSPFSVEDKPVWWAQTNQFFSDWLGQSVLDPDVDDATVYLLHDLWYGQGLASYAWVRGAPFEGESDNFFDTPFFSTGLRAVLWLSASPVSMLETKRLDLNTAAVTNQ